MGIDVGSDRNAASVLYAYDDHPDGKLDLIEFARLASDVEERGGVAARPEVLPPMDMVPPRVRAAFELFDEDYSGFIEAPELRRALRHYGIDLTEYETASVLAQYDDHPDAKLDLIEFANLVRDASRGFVLTSNNRSHAALSTAAPTAAPSAAATLAAAAAARVSVVSNAGRFGVGGEWPHHESEAARLARLRDELARDDAVALRKEGFWGDPNGEWVRNQLQREASGRHQAEAEAKVAKAEAAAAIARVEALQAAAAARELEIEAAVARVHRTDILDHAPSSSGAGANAVGSGGGNVGGGRKGGPNDLPPSNSGDIAKQTTPNGETARAALAAVAAVPMGRSQVHLERDVEKRQAQMLEVLVGRLEVGLLDHLDNRAREDSDRARSMLLVNTFRGPMVGARPNDKHVGRTEFLAAMGILGLPQPPAVLPPTQKNTLKQPVVKSDESLNREVLHAFYGKYAAENGLLDFETLYKRVAKNAVRRKHGESRSMAAMQQDFQDKLGRSKYPPNGGRPFVAAPMKNFEPLVSVLNR